MFKVGELARRTRLTVRTLHFYEEIGLLKPSERTDSGHRIYGAAEVARLQRITSLRQLGLTLEEIGDLLDGREGAPDRVLQRHIEHLRGQIASARKLVARLEHLQATLQDEPGVDDLLAAIEETVMFDKYYTDEQLEQLEQQRNQLGEAGMQQAQQDWADLIARAKAAQQAGMPPDAPEAQAIATRWQALIDAFTGGDPGIRQGLDNLWRDQQQAMAQRSGIDPELMAWVGEAIRHLGG